MHAACLVSRYDTRYFGIIPTDNTWQMMTGDHNEVYDLIIVGTGIVESILSCFAAKNGKKVLHLDRNDYYGSNVASFSFSSMVKTFQLGSLNPHGCLVLRNDFSSNGVLVDTFSALNRWTDNRGKVHPSFLSTCDKHEFNIGNRPLDQLVVHPAWLFMDSSTDAVIAYSKKDKDFTIDMNCKFLIGSGKFIDALIESGVSNYLDFNTSGSIYYFQPNTNSKDKAGWKIPLNKNDIFMSNKLSAMDKRSLVKFQQFVADYCHQKNGADIKRVNELELAKGRSLHRPQNKNEAIVAVEKMSFKDILDSFKLSPSLQALIFHGLCLQMNPDMLVDPSNLLSRISTFLDAVGRYGGTPFLLPCYGISEILQGFCRMSAVWGTTFALRRGVSEFLDDANNETVSVVDTDGNVHATKFLVLNCHYLAAASMKLQPWFILHSIHFYESPIFEEFRSVVVIPPNFRFEHLSQHFELKNENAIFMCEKDSSTCCCPAGTYMLHMTTQINCVDNGSEWLGCRFREEALSYGSHACSLVDKLVVLLQHQTGGAFFETRQITYLEPVFQAKDISSRVHISNPIVNDIGSIDIESDYCQAEILWKRMFQEPFNGKAPTNNDHTATDFNADEENKAFTDLFIMLNK